MSTISTEHIAPTSESRPVLLLYGEEYANLALADELELDGFEVRRASDPAMLRTAGDACEVELVIFGRATRRGAGLDVLRGLRAGTFAPEVKRELRTLWMSPNDDLGDVLRRFEAGADDVVRAPFAYLELRSRTHGLRADKFSGASRARTDDLLAASQTLFQLSYSPESAFNRITLDLRGRISASGDELRHVQIAAGIVVDAATGVGETPFSAGCAGATSRRCLVQAGRHAAVGQTHVA